MPTSPPKLTLAIIADVQYADKSAKEVQNTYGSYIRHYQQSLSILSKVIRTVNNDPAPSCLVHLGDCIDGSPTISRSLSDLKSVLRAFSRSRLPIYHVVGNHCLSVPRPILQHLIPAFNPSFYYKQRLDCFWTLIVLDTSDVSISGTDAAKTKQAEDWLAAHPSSPNCKRWNGGVSATQLSWLKGALDSLDCCGNPGYALVATHIPLLPSAADPTHVIFNGEEVSSLLDSYSTTVKLVLSGHFHRGGETLSKGGIRHRTVKGIVEDGGLEYCDLLSNGVVNIISDPHK